MCRLTAALMVTGAIAAGCGKRGAPMAPFVRIPVAPGPIETRRTGNDVYVTVKVPAQNIDTFGPADVRRVEVYGHTGVTPPPPARFLEVATLVATIPVAPAPPPGVPRPAPAPGAPLVTAAGVVQGTNVTLRDTLEPEDLVPRALPPLAGRALTPAPNTDKQPDAALRRFYLAIAFTDRGRPGPRSAVAEIPLALLPDSPSGLQATYSADAVSLRWEPSGGLLGFLLDRELPIEAPPFDLPPSSAASSSLLARPSGPTRYNVYRDIAPDPLALPVVQAPRTTWHVPPPVAVNSSPLTTLEFADSLQLDERPRCYHVRAVRGAAPLVVEGVASARVCVTPVDVFPPEVPTGVSALAAEGVISLIWEPNVDLDLAGYVVLRQDTGGATLLPLTPTPISETRFTDRTVRPGVRYVYAVQAVDNRVPLPNVSAPSAIIEETAR